MQIGCDGAQAHAEASVPQRGGATPARPVEDQLALGVDSNNLGNILANAVRFP